MTKCKKHSAELLRVVTLTMRRIEGGKLSDHRMPKNVESGDRTQELPKSPEEGLTKIERPN